MPGSMYRAEALAELAHSRTFFHGHRDQPELGIEDEEEEDLESGLMPLTSAFWGTLPSRAKDPAVCTTDVAVDLFPCALCALPDGWDRVACQL